MWQSKPTGKLKRRWPKSLDHYTTKGDAKKLLTKGKVVLADLAGDKAILSAMKSNEEQTNSEYEKAVKKGYEASIQTILERGLADERRHKAWIEQTLDRL